MRKRVFYSWQSDSPNNLNRGFIETCIEKSIKDITGEEINLEVAIDRDTKNTAGSADISKTIFDKIKAASIFIADMSVSLIPKLKQERHRIQMC